MQLFQSFRRNLLAVLLLAAAFSTDATAQVDYSLSFDTEARTWSVDTSFANPAKGAPSEDGKVDFWIARWTPGAYHIADYGRFVEELTATTGQGESLPVERVSDSHFVIDAGSAQRVKVHYEASSISTEMFTANIIDVECNRLTPDYAYVTPVSLFGFVPQLMSDEIRLELQLPEGWTAATAMEQDEKGVYHSPSYFRFEDSPILMSGDLKTSEFVIDGVPHAVTVHGKSQADTDAVADGCKAIVHATKVFMQGLPYDRYHFLIGFVPEAQGSGLEHSYSTLILVPNLPISQDNEAFWGIVAHEFFHTWCAERIHVEGIHDPDYTRPFETGTIWVNEGITEYFTQHILLHGGFIDQDTFLQKLAGGAGQVQMMRDQIPGAKNAWTEVSRRASRWEDQNALMSFAVKSYLLGPRVIFALDMEMRRASAGERGILDLLRFLRYAYIDLDRGFEEGEMIGFVNGVAQADLTDFYERYIDGSEFPDLAKSLEVIGYAESDGAVHPVDSPTVEQLHARADFFALPEADQR